jgi:uncharacterized protein with FMN-binding domain
MAAARVHRGLVALSASAVAAVYLAGYAQTQAADAGIGQAAQAAVVVASTATASPQPPVVVASTGTASPQAPVVAPRIVAPTASTVGAPGAIATRTVAQAAFKDGTFTGQGSSRRGGVSVSVVVQSGRIASVSIVDSTLQYPVRDIAGLPAQVVQRQSARVDTVSRATYSSQAFRAAVSQALAKAT